MTLISSLSWNLLSLICSLVHLVRVPFSRQKWERRMWCQKQRKLFSFAFELIFVLSCTNQILVEFLFQYFLKGKWNISSSVFWYLWNFSLYFVHYQRWFCRFLSANFLMTMEMLKILWGSTTFQWFLRETEKTFWNFLFSHYKRLFCALE